MDTKTFSRYFWIISSEEYEPLMISVSMKIWWPFLWDQQIIENRRNRHLARSSVWLILQWFFSKITIANVIQHTYFSTISYMAAKIQETESIHKRSFSCSVLDLIYYFIYHFIYNDKRMSRISILDLPDLNGRTPVIRKFISTRWDSMKSEAIFGSKFDYCLKKNF